MKLICVDLGDRVDYTAISILEDIDHVEANKQFLPGTDEEIIAGYEKIYDVHIRFLERMQLGSGYPNVIARVKEIMNNPILGEDKIILLVDATGVGVPVIQMMREEGLKPIGITITGGLAESVTDIGFTVPKRELVSALQILFQSRRLKIPKDIPFKDEFVDELQNFRVKITANANETFGAGRESVHDDIVLSVSMGAWYFSRIKGNRIKMNKSPIGKRKKKSARSLGVSVADRFSGIGGRR